MSNNIIVKYLKFFLIDLLGDVLFFPIWWYTVGLKKFGIFFWRVFTKLNSWLDAETWAINLFVPMYGQNDIASKLISFVIRLVQLVIRTIILVFVGLIILALYIIWVLLPLLVIYNLIKKWI